MTSAARTTPNCLARTSLLWQETQDAAQLANDPCTFSAFNAYEWTKVEDDPTLSTAKVPPSCTATSSSGATRSRSAPISVFEAPKVELLWDQLQQQLPRRRPRLRRPHDPAQHEPECGPGVQAGLHRRAPALVPLLRGAAPHRGGRRGPCSLRARRRGHSAQGRLGVPHLHAVRRRRPVPGQRRALRLRVVGLEREPLPHAIPNQPLPRLSYVREGLKEGLVQEEALGANPFKLGMLASTDTHNSTPGHDQRCGVRRHRSHGNQRRRSHHPSGAITSVARQRNAGGLAVVWAEENTREAIFDAIDRKEVYATSGGRPIVRFFGSWEVALRPL